VESPQICGVYFENWRGDQRKPAGILQNTAAKRGLATDSRNSYKYKIKKLLPNESS